MKSDRTSASHGWRWAAYLAMLVAALMLAVSAVAVAQTTTDETTTDETTTETETETETETDVDVETETEFTTETEFFDEDFDETIITTGETTFPVGGTGAGAGGTATRDSSTLPFVLGAAGLALAITAGTLLIRRRRTE